MDAVVNHMTGLGRLGTSYDGSTYDGDAHDFPGVPFSIEHFTPKNLCPSGDGITINSNSVCIPVQNEFSFEPMSVKKTVQCES